MKNMGLQRLIVVDPAPSFDPERARWMAPGATDVLHQMRLVSTLDEALEGVHRAVATTARHRSRGQRSHEPTDVARSFLDTPPGRVTAILFGREDMGLANEHSRRCESLLRIPTAEHASLNLGQAVLLVCHALFEEARTQGMTAGGRTVGGHGPIQSTRALERREDSETLADLPTVEPAVIELVALLNRVGHSGAKRPEQLGALVREGLQRASITDVHVRTLRSIVRRLEFALDRPDVDWKASRRQQQARATTSDDTSTD
jgi:tRNA/rRNA methyltransferase